jgi:ABC-type uncharacterized transport system ATPase subunit
MKSGEIIEQGAIAEITSSRGGYELSVPAAEGLREWLLEKTVAFAAANGHFHIQTPDRASANALIDSLRGRKVEIESLTVKRRSLESVFIDRIGGAE